MININVSDLIKSVRSLGEELEKSTEIIKSGLDDISRAFDEFNPSDSVSESITAFQMMEREFVNISNISQLTFAVISQGIFEMASYLTGAGIGLNNLNAGMANLSDGVRTLGQSLKDLEEALKNVEKADTASAQAGKQSTEETKKKFEEFQKLLQFSDNVTTALKSSEKVLNDIGTAFNLTSAASAAATGTVTKFAAALGGVGLALTAVDLVLKAINWSNEKQKEATENLREFNKEAIKFEEIMSALINDNNVEYYREMAEEIDKLNVSVKAYSEAWEDYLTFENEKFLTFDNWEVQNEKYEELIAGLMEAEAALTEILKEFGLDVEEHFKRIYDGTIDTVLIDMLDEVYDTFSKNHEIYEQQRLKELLTNEKVYQSINTQLSSMNQLEQAYKNLAAGEELSAENLIELSQLYPNVGKYINENAVSREGLMEVIEAERQLSKKAGLEEIEIKKSELLAEKGRPEGLIESYQTDASAHNISLAEKKEGLLDFLEFSGEIVKGIMNGAKASSIAAAGKVEIVANQEALNALRTKVSEIDNQISLLDAQAKLLGELPDKIEIELPELPELPKLPSQPSYLGASAARYVPPIAEAIEKEISEFEKQWDNYKQLKEKEELKSLSDQKKWLDENLANVKKTYEERAEYEAEYNGLIVKITEDAREKIDKAIQSESHNEIIENLKLLLNEYEEYGDSVIKIQKEITKAIEEQTNLQNQAVKEAADALRQLTDNSLSEIERRHQILRSYDGIRYASGENDVFQYTIDMEISKIQALIAEEEKYINTMKAKKDELSDYEKKKLEEAEESVKKHNLNLETSFHKASERTAKSP